MTVSNQEALEIIQQSEKVLIGIGEEFSKYEVDYTNSSLYHAFEEKRKQEPDFDNTDWMIEVIKENYINTEISAEDLPFLDAFKNLKNMIKDKDYFIVDMNANHLLEKYGFAEDKIVYPCGSTTQYQCKNNCSNEIYSAKEIESSIINQIFDKQIKLSQIKRPTCKKCGEVLVYNRVEKDNYCEEGYLKRWKEYQDWTARTLNRSLCVLELGVNFRYPTVIRWPFERIVFINNKASLIRVNEKFSQVSSELANKCIAIKENAIKFLLQLQ